jgi:chromosome segregation ATPase
MENIKGVVNDVVEFTKQSFNTIAKATKKAFDNKDVLAAAEANIQKLQTLYQGIVEKYDLMAEQQRKIRDDEFKTLDERIKANEELQRVLAEGEQKEKENIQARMGILQMQQNLLGANKDRANELLALQQELTGVTAKYAGISSEAEQNANALKKEGLDIQKAYNESKIAQLEITNEAVLAEKQADVERAELEKNELKRIEKVKDAQTELHKEELRQLEELNKKRMEVLDSELKQYKEGTSAYNEALIAKEEAQAQYDADKKTKETEFATWSAQNEKALTDFKISQQEALASAVTGALQSIASAVGEETAAGKTLAVASAIIDTYMGANKALAAGAGTPIGYINMAAILATGFANVRRMVATPVPGATDTSSSAPSGPSVSIVGGSADPSAQLAKSLASQQQKPIKAYTVATDMSTQQALDRRIQQNATFPG